MTNMKFSSNQIHPQQSDFDDVNRVQQSSLMLNCLIESSTDKVWTRFDTLYWGENID